MPELREVVITEAVRTPIGREHEEKGYYKNVHPARLLGLHLRGVDFSGRDRRS